MDDPFRKYEDPAFLRMERKSQCDSLEAVAVWKPACRKHKEFPEGRERWVEECDSGHAEQPNVMFLVCQDFLFFFFSLKKKFI